MCWGWLSCILGFPVEVIFCRFDESVFSETWLVLCCVYCSLNSRRVKQCDVWCERSRMTRGDLLRLSCFECWNISGLYSCIKFLLHRVLLTPDLLFWKKQKQVIELRRGFAWAAVLSCPENTVTLERRFERTNANTSDSRSHWQWKLRRQDFLCWLF